MLIIKLFNIKISRRINTQWAMNKQSKLIKKLNFDEKWKTYYKLQKLALKSINYKNLRIYEITNS